MILGTSYIELRKQLDPITTEEEISQVKLEVNNAKKEISLVSSSDIWEKDDEEKVIGVTSQYAGQIVSDSGIKSQVDKIVTDFDTFEQNTSTQLQTIDGFINTATHNFEDLDGFKTNTTEFIQNSQQFQTTVEQDYAKKTTVTQLADKVTTLAEDVDGNYTELKQDSERIEQIVGSKSDSVLTAFRYIRDWLDDTSAESKKEFLECQIFAQNVNISSGKTPKLLDQNGNAISTDVDLSRYTDGNIDTSQSIVITNTGWVCLQLDLGGIRRDIDEIKIWHNYFDNKVYSHRLQVSMDGKKWHTIFDSEVQGGYEETETGHIYYVNDGRIDSNFASISSTINNIELKVQENEDNLASLSLNADDISMNVAHNAELLSQLSEVTSDQTNSLKEVLATQASLGVDVDGIYAKVQQLLENDELHESELTQSSTEWKILFKKLGMYDGDDVPEQQTNVAMSIDGLTVSNPISGERTLITKDEFAGYYNDEKVFQLNKDLTITRRLQSEMGVDFTTIKYVPTTYTVGGKTVGALAHVKSGGSS